MVSKRYTTISLITRTYTFTDGTTAYGSQVNSEINNIVNTLNNLDAASLSWDNVKVITLTLAGNANANSFKITGLAAATTSGDALSYGGVLNGTTLTLSSTVNSNLSFDNTSTHGIVGSTTNDAAAAGNVGEYKESAHTGNTNLPISSGQWGDITSLSLTAGDWLVTAIAPVNQNGATSFTFLDYGISTTSGNSSTGLNIGQNYFESPAPGAAADVTIIVPTYRISLSGTTTIYFKVNTTFATATPITQGYRLSAWRVR